MAAFDPARALEVYDELGWYATNFPVLDGELLRDVRELVRDIESRPRDLILPAALEQFFELPASERRPQRFNQYIAFQYQAVADLLLTPLIGQIAATLARASEIRVFNTALIVKEPGSAARYANVGWHCDRAFWPTCSSDRMLTAWIPLQDTTAQLGTLQVLNGSHRWLDDERFCALRTSKAFVADNRKAVQETLQSARRDFQPVPVELRAGQVSFHHMATLHGSGVNTDSETRYAFSLHLQDGGNRYQAALEADGSPASYVHDQFVRRSNSGEPDYSDPEICPVIWPAK